MLHFPRWQIVLILLLVMSGLVAAAPNLLSKETVDSWPNWLPKQQVLLGLDLQGGAYLLYEVDSDDYIEKRLRALTSDVRRTMLENPRIGYTGLGIQGQSVQLRVRDLDRLDDVRIATGAASQSARHGLADHRDDL
jgi:preprotein translocase subunit SecD